MIFLKKIISKIVCHCSNCGNEIIIKENELAGAYDLLCESCEEQYAQETNQQLEEFLRKEEPYLYDD